VEIVLFALSHPTPPSFPVSPRLPPSGYGGRDCTLLPARARGGGRVLHLWLCGWFCQPPAENCSLHLSVVVTACCCRCSDPPCINTPPVLLIPMEGGRKRGGGFHFLHFAPLPPAFSLLVP